MKKSIKVLIFFTIVLLVFVNSCKLKTIDPDAVDVGYDYYPLEIGSYIIYNEYDTIYDPSKVTDTLYHVKEIVHRSYMEGMEEKFEIYRFTKKVTDSDWPLQPDSLWTVVKNSNQLLRTESNIEYIKLVFPVKEGKAWNGNAKNTSGEFTSSDKFYKMINLNKPYTINNIVYPNTLKMVISNQSDPIVSKDIRYDIYARGIGFVKKDYTVYYYKQEASFPPRTIDYGSRKIMEITSYGKE